MFIPGTIIASRFLVHGLCSSAGGMGTIVFVSYVGTHGPFFALKFCNSEAIEIVARFRREVRVMQQFRGNPFVVPIIEANLEHSPPFFVMPYFEYGDMKACGAHARHDLITLESYFYRMIDCIAELHSCGVMHRDIKPQNFLVGAAGIVVSDLGLCSQPGSATAFTRSSAVWGTDGYLPPEFLHGDFKHAEPSGDIFMLGKTFYSILCDRNPAYLLPQDIPPALFAVIERCCVPRKEDRYSDLRALRNSLKVAFDATLGRVLGNGNAYDSLRRLMDMVQGKAPVVISEFSDFVEHMGMLPAADKVRICLNLNAELIAWVSQYVVPHGVISSFLDSYGEMTNNATYEWHFAEVIADNMKALFNSPFVSNANKANAFKLAAVGAYRQNRFAAMDTCAALLESVADPELGQRLHDVVVELSFDFMTRWTDIQLRSPAIRAGLDEVVRRHQERYGQ